MIVSAIADPSIFGPDVVVDELTARELCSFLLGIIHNGVLLCDPTRQLLRDAMANADALSKQPGGTKRGQRISGLLQGIYNQHKKYVVSCEDQRWNTANPTTIIQQIAVLSGILKADAVVAPMDKHAELAERDSLSSVEIIAPQDISVSRYEAVRLKVATVDKPLDQMSLAEIEEHIGRAVKYCGQLRVFDYRMVARTRSVPKYREGIQFVLLIWAKWSVVAASSRTVELYTVGNTQTQDRFLTGDDAKALLFDEIVAVLRTAGVCNAIGYVMEDSNRIFHARGFEAKKRAFTIDPGFDALSLTGPNRRCLFKADVAAEKHFEECRALRTL